MKPSELIRQRGWCQGAFENADGCLCVHEAVHFSYNPPKRHIERRNAMLASLQSDGWNGFMHWNDAPGRTSDEVIAKLEEFGL